MTRNAFLDFLRTLSKLLHNQGGHNHCCGKQLLLLELRRDAIPASPHASPSRHLPHPTPPITLRPSNRRPLSESYKTLCSAQSAVQFASRLGRVRIFSPICGSPVPFWRSELFLSGSRGSRKSSFIKVCDWRKQTFLPKVENLALLGTSVPWKCGVWECVTGSC